MLEGKFIDMHVHCLNEFGIVVLFAGDFCLNCQ